MSEYKKDIWNIVLTAGFLFVFSLASILKPAEEVSLQERRKLAQFPEVSMKSVLDGRFSKGFEAYVMDQFPGRNAFLQLNTVLDRYVLGRKDIDGITVHDGAAYAMEYPMHIDSIEHAAHIFTKIQDTYLNEDNHVYVSVIPDKSKFLGDDALKMDHAAFAQKVKDALPAMQYIDIMSTLTVEDYYKTDPHWRQEKIVDTADVLIRSMGGSTSTAYEVEKAADNFLGSYGGKVPGLKKEDMYYLTNDRIEKLTVYDAQNDREIDVYDMKKANGRDPYEMYLSGPLSLIKIHDPTVKNGRKLVLFRDSFGSAIAPLLTGTYEDITLVDIRYLPSALLGNKVDFTNADVLFLYSTSVLNHSETLK